MDLHLHDLVELKKPHPCGSTRWEILRVGMDIKLALEQLKVLMEACMENREDICSIVADMVPTYRPAGKNGSEEKGKTYESLVKEMASV